MRSGRKSKRKNKKLAVAEKYIADIISDKIKVSEYAKKAFLRHKNDLEKSKKKSFEYYFDEFEGLRIIEFFGFLHHSKGEWAGTVFKPSPWQQALLFIVFGWRKKEDGTRRFRTVYLEVPRKNGKTTLAAGIGLFLLDGDEEPGAEIYSAATKYDQAKICHTDAVRMVKSSPLLRDHISVYRNNLSVDMTASKFEPVGRDHDTLDGLNVSGAIVDELHVHKTRDMWDVIDTATGSRRQPLIFTITTAGFDRNTICWENHQYVEKILDGIIEDDSFFGIIYSIDLGDDKNPGDDWTDEETWKKANPNYGISAYPHDIKRKCKKAIEMPSAQNAFLRKHLDVWTQSETAWITHELWRTCASPVDPDGLKGRTCYAGLDLSNTRDVTALVLVFPPMAAGDHYCVLPRFFIPQDNIEKRVRRDRVNYDVWVRQGFMMATAGNRVDLDFIVNQVDQDATTYDLLQIAYDRWGASQIVNDLKDLGYDEEPSEDETPSRCLVRFGQGYASMSPPSKELERLVLGAEVAHGGNPVLAWMMSNVIMTEDPAGNIKPDKKKSSEKIDGIVALLMGLDRAIRHFHEESVYEGRGILLL